MLEGMKGVSSFASEVDLAILVVVGLCVVIFFLVVGVMFYFLYKYSSKRHARKDVKNIEHNLPLEIIWTVAPMLLLAVMFYYGYTSLKAMRTIPKENIEINVVGQMWFWTHEYPNGKKTKDLYVPIGENIKLNISAKENDVLHSYYVPALRLKQDAVPGKTYKAWFRGTETGAFDLQCAEYCGSRHSYMLAKVYVLEKDVFDAWYNSDKKTPFDKESKTAPHPALALLNDNGCTGCHSLDGSALVGPSYKDIFNRNVKVSIDGSLKEVVSDEEYLKRAILEPDFEIVDGFSAGMMSSYKDVLSPKDIDTIIDYFKGGSAPSKIDIEAEAMNILDSNGCTGCHSLDGSALVGPSYKDMFGRSVKVSVDGNLKEIVTDEEYLKRAILEPNFEVVDGFSAGMMSSYKDVLSEDDINLLIQYFKGSDKKDSTPQAKTLLEPVQEVKETVKKAVTEEIQKVTEEVSKKEKEQKSANEILNANACLGCHSLDGSRRVGPSYKGMFERVVKVKVDGTLKEVVSDEAYLKRAILEPNYEVVDTYPGIMTSYKGILSDDDIAVLIEYFKGL